jgi:SPP1 gp7 family putative phage head morphogenesis protein
VHHADDLIVLGWSEASEALAAQMTAADSGIFEGVAVVRALRKMLSSSPGKPVDQVLVLRQPHLKLNDGQARMAKACETMLQGITAELLARGVEMVDAISADAPGATPRMDEAGSTIKGMFDRARAWVAGQYPAKRIALLAQQNALRVQDNVVTQVDGAIKRVVKIDVFSPMSGVADHLSAFVAQNVVLIQNLTEQTLAQTHATVLEGLRQGLRAEEIKKNLRDKVGLSETKATILANDQVGKLHGELTQLRQTSLGLKRYTWATSRDELVRPSHAALDGTVQRWDDPPIVNEKTGLRAHPGFDTHFYPCRCSAIPMLDDVLQEAGLLPANDVVESVVQKPPPSSLPTPPPWRPPVPAPELPIVVPPLPQPPPANVDLPSARLGATAERIFGRKLTDPELDSVFGMDAKLPAGFRLSIDRIRENEKHLELRVYGSIKNAAGEDVADIQRRYEITDGVASVNHSLFVLADDLQNQGIGKAVFNAQIAAYKRLGVVKSVTLDAAWVGRYVWTKAGFDWSFAFEQRLKTHLRAKLLSKVSAEAADKILATIETPQDVATLELDDGERIGKAFLLDYPEDLVPMSQTPDKIRDL